MKRRDVLQILPAAAGGLALAGAARASAGPALPLHADLSWWREARFGMFVHWGPVSLRGTEIGWSRGKEVPVEEYDGLYRRFDPTLFDARAWARLAKDAGMGYLVLTTKHHDGFCLWPSALTDYDIEATPFRRDVRARALGRLPRRGDRLLRLPLDLRLAAPGLPAREPRRQHPEGRPGHGSLHGLPEGPARRAPAVLRAARGPLVRRRVGRALDGGAREGPLPLLPLPAAVAHRQQPRGEGPAGHGRHHRRRGLRRGLRHPRAAGGPVPGRPAVGVLHHHLPAVGVEARRRDEDARRVRADAGDLRRRRRQPAAERRPDADGRDRGAPGRPAPRDRRLAAGSTARPSTARAAGRSCRDPGASAPTGRGPCTRTCSTGPPRARWCFRRSSGRSWRATSSAAASRRRSRGPREPRFASRPEAAARSTPSSGWSWMARPARSPRADARHTAFPRLRLPCGWRRTDDTKRETRHRDPGGPGDRPRLRAQGARRPRPRSGDPAPPAGGRHPQARRREARPDPPA